MQCHLEGKAAIERPGRHIYDFQPGQQLSDYVRYFVFAEQQRPGLGAVGQFEALAQSVCKKKSGEAMSCYQLSRSPHRTLRRGPCFVLPAEVSGVSRRQVRNYASRGQSDCTACHMPSSLSRDIAHTEVTDHRILRQPGISPQFLQDAQQSYIYRD